MTPGSAPNWASGVQNQPTAKLMVSTFAGAAASIGGMADVIRATESLSFEKQPKAARIAAGRNLFTSIVY